MSYKILAFQGTVGLQVTFVLCSTFFWFMVLKRCTVLTEQYLKLHFLCYSSRFAKNLSHDQIHLSTLKGEGELKNLELNEEVLTELLELPSWLRLSGATCNRVAVRIQWTKLKSVPIHLSLDEVINEYSICRIFFSFWFKHSSEKNYTLLSPKLAAFLTFCCQSVLIGHSNGLFSIPLCCLDFHPPAPPSRVCAVSLKWRHSHCVFCLCLGRRTKFLFLLVYIITKRLIYEKIICMIFHFQ